MNKKIFIIISVVLVSLILFVLATETLDINSPTNTTYETNEVIFNVTATDSDGVDSCWFSLDDGENVSLEREIIPSSLEFTKTSFSFSTMDNPSGITQNDTFFWVADGTNTIIQKYWINGTNTGDSFNSFGSIEGLENNNTFIWITDDTDAEVYKFYMNGTYTQDHFDTDISGNGNLRDLTMNNTFFWITDQTDSLVYKYYINGTYTQDNFPTGSGDDAITNNGTFFWIGDASLGIIDKYWMNGTYIEQVINLPDNPGQLTTNGTYFWANDIVDDVVYEYVLDNSTLLNFYTYTNSSMTEGFHNVTFYCNDTLGNLNISTQYFTVSSADTTAPTFSTIPANVSGNYLSTNVNADFDFDDETAISMIFINDTSNFTMDNSTGILTNKTPLFVGNYALNVTINDSANNINWTIFTVAVSQIASQGSISGTASITYGTAGDVTGSESNIGDADVVYTLYRNLTAVSNPDTSILAVDFYSYIYNATAGQNYSANSSIGEFNLTVNQDTSICGIQFNETSPLQSPRTFLVWSNCSTANYLMRNGTIITNNSEQSLSVGAYNFSTNRTDTQNYSSIYSERQFIITSASDTTSPIITLISPINDGEDSDGIVDFKFNVSDASSIANCSLYLDSILISTDTSITNNQYNTFHRQLTDSQKKNSLNWYVSCYDSSSNLGTSSTFVVDTLVGSGVFHNTQGGETTTIPEGNLKCEVIYFLVLSTNYNYTDEQLELMNLTREDIYNYSSLCANSGYPLLPKINAPEIILESNKIDYCDYKTKNMFWSSFPFFKINVGWSCNSINFWKHFFSLEKTEGEYYINGIVFLPLLFLLNILLFAGIFLYKKIKGVKNED